MIISGETDVEDVNTLKMNLLEDSLDIIPTGMNFCFNRKAFLNEYFDAEDFVVQQFKMGTSLEILNNNLMLYHNVLKNGLVELINRDYEVFLHLSTKLKGLDKFIGDIHQPLDQYKAELKEQVDKIEDLKQNLLTTLEEKREIGRQKDLIHHIHIVSDCINSLEQWLNPIDSGVEMCESKLPAGALTNASDSVMEPWPEDTFYKKLNEDPGQRIDRVTNKYIKLVYFSKRCQDHPIIKKWETRINWITQNINEQLEIRLRKGIDCCFNKTSDEIQKMSLTKRKEVGQVLRQALHTYASLDRVPDAEYILRKFYLREKLTNVLHLDSLKGTTLVEFSSILEEQFSNSLKVLDELTSMVETFIHKNASDISDSLTEFDACINVFWPEFVDLVLQNQELFSAGDPDKFHKAFNLCMWHLDEIEDKLSDSSQIVTFRKHPSTLSYLSKWNLSVYFRIRFKHLMATVENSAVDPFSMNSVPNTDFKLSISRSVREQIEFIWSDGVYLDGLRDRFLHLTLQTLHRYAAILENVGAKDYSNSFAPKSIRQTVQQDGALEEKKPGKEQILCLIYDASLWNNLYKEQLWTSAFVKKIESSFMNDDREDSTARKVESCFDSAFNYLNECSSKLRQIVIGLVVEECGILLRQMSDVPRMYRRTNRDYPTTASGYVASVVKCLRQLSSQVAACITNPEKNNSDLDAIVQMAAKSITKTFQSQLKDLLLSVRKTGDSLRKLREARQGNQISVSASRMSPDDEKIFQQLNLDVQEFYSKVKEVTFVDVSRLPELQELQMLVNKFTDEIAN